MSPDASAREAGLRYVTDDRPGIRRRRAGRGFVYLDARGRRVTDDATLARIRSLAVPPAWKDVWICADPRGHVQATGRDARGRKQYRYHPQWRRARDGAKFDRMLAFGEALPRIRARVERDLRRKGLPREKVLALVVRLLEETLVRVGNDEYARANGSFGLTTLRDGHARVDGGGVRFVFRGKGGRRHRVEVDDAGLARIVRRCQELPGQELFQYVDADGTVQDVRSEDVNAYIREASGGDFSAKDFRTFAATVLCAVALAEEQEPTTQKEARSQVVRALESVAERLGNTPQICRRSYVHPGVVQAHLDGVLARALERQVRADGRVTPDEARVLDALQRRALR